MFKSILKRAVLLVLALPLILLILELGIRIVVPQPVEDLAFEDVYTERYSPSLKENVISLVPGIIRFKNNAEVYINNQGMRDYDYLYDKKEDVTRIAIVGSSVTFGYNLELKDTYGKQLEEKLNGETTKTEYEVLLFGRPGFSAKESYAEIEDRVFNYDPDLIIYSFVQNNYEDQSAEEFFSNMVDSSPNIGDENPTSLLQLIRRNWGEIRSHNAFRFIRTNFHLYLFSTNSLVRVLREISPEEKEKAQNIDPLSSDTLDFKHKIANTESWISLMNRDCADRDIQFAILMHPYEMQLNQEGVEKWRGKGFEIPDDVLDVKTHLIMEKFSDGEGIYFMNIIPALRSYTGNDSLFIEGDYAHYDILGHKIISDYLTEEIFNILK
jgi:hypothetical protein